MAAAFLQSDLVTIPKPMYSWKDGWTHEMATIPSASMSADDKTSRLDTSAWQILCHFFKWFVSETVRLNRCYKMVEIKWSMSYPCLMIPIMSSSIRFELKLISGLPANVSRPERTTNRQTDRRIHQYTMIFLYPSQLVWVQNGDSNKNVENDKKSQFLWWCDLDLWHMTMKNWSVRDTITATMCTKFENNPSRAFWVIAWTICAEGGLNIKP